MTGTIRPSSIATATPTLILRLASEALVRPVGVERRVPLERVGRGLDDERDEGEADALLRLVGALEALPELDEAGRVDLHLDVGVRRLERPRHLRGDALAHRWSSGRGPRRRPAGRRSVPGPAATAGRARGPRRRLRSGRRPALEPGAGAAGRGRGIAGAERLDVGEDVLAGDPAAAARCRRSRRAARPCSRRRRRTAGVMRASGSPAGSASSAGPRRRARRPGQEQAVVAVGGVGPAVGGRSRAAVGAAAPVSAAVIGSGGSRRGLVRGLDHGDLGVVRDGGTLRRRGSRAARPRTATGTSALTLSVTTSTRGSYFATVSPGCFSQRPIVPSATLSPSWGIVTLATGSVPPMGVRGTRVPGCLVLRIPRRRVGARRPRRARRMVAALRAGAVRLVCPCHQRRQLREQVLVDRREVERGLALQVPAERR